MTVYTEATGYGNNINTTQKHDLLDRLIKTANCLSLDSFCFENQGKYADFQNTAMYHQTV